MTAVLEIDGLSKAFDLHHLGNRIAAFSKISFAVDAGEFVLLKGANGAGKSTLLRTLYRSYLPQAGQIRFQSSHGEIDLARAAEVDIAYLRRSEIGFVTQFLTARPRVSAEAIVAEPLRLAGVAADDALEQARHALDIFGVKPDLWPAYPTTFSGGEQQKVNLARALILPQRLLLLDEPTASLDAKARAALVARLAELKSQGTAMIGVFHHPDDVEHLIDRIVDLTPDHYNEEDRADVAV
ncbi:Alpha-D-ribose 1-methylphosphonate 5-triphosphate synthase subunit PhnL [Pelagimonas phthalicica]|uniref:Alpha-D-ribose 1-methylphosphonate 5-triphosphate synthase subunit PhnL n=1 Tax=Pelagimonas phthalicica TaxID=1037362 RepID=A0A238JB96_9RHOB|nr:ATP-binding cassette domain-containing protein [Pelagimonas phthalicica]TDS93823.1 alpha-D-ribose 1-methylphosphonate 5-triphosphate synthase subunit PhnL [Pelagimonas phthalicica]SMX27653.1 Alpha-D-ribose 1-methylphosphonate 5-triphosphate synthase subunit PhnL [Pelagimonas phthalicica]